LDRSSNNNFIFYNFSPLIISKEVDDNFNSNIDKNKDLSFDLNKNFNSANLETNKQASVLKINKND